MLARLTADTLRVLPRKRISRALGRVADVRVPRPVLQQAIDAFVRIYDIDLSDAIIPLGGYRSFDDFFTRQLVAGARPIDADVTAILSPADGRIEDLGSIDPAGSLLVKGRRYDVAELVDDPAAAELYRGGTYFIVYLSPQDYHRVHAPVTGAVVCARHVPGTLFPVNSIGLDHIPRLFARNERVAIVQQTAVGAVTTVMVGAIGVGRISLAFDHQVWTNAGRESGVREYGQDGPPIERGEELGTFHLGSTAIVFVPPGDHTFVVDGGGRTRMGEAVMRGGVI